MVYEIMLFATRDGGWSARVQGRGPGGEEFSAKTHEYKAALDSSSREYALREAEAVIWCNRRFGALDNAWSEVREYLKAYLGQGTYLVRILPRILRLGPLTDEELDRALIEAVETNAKTATVIALMLLEVRPEARAAMNHEARRTA